MRSTGEALGDVEFYRIGGKVRKRGNEIRDEKEREKGRERALVQSRTLCPCLFS